MVFQGDLASDNIQNVEIVTDGDIDSNTILNNVVGSSNNGDSFVFVNQPGNQSINIIDSDTG